MPRPQTYSAALAARVCSRIANGESLKALCRRPGMPAIATIHLWLTRHEAFRRMHQAACEARADVLVEEMLAIADDSSGDFKPARTGAAPALDRENLQRAKLRIEVRRWRAARLAPHKYGDRPGGGVPGDAPAAMSHEDALDELD